MNNLGPIQKTVGVRNQKNDHCTSFIDLSVLVTLLMSSHIPFVEFHHIFTFIYTHTLIHLYIRLCIIVNQNGLFYTFFVVWVLIVVTFGSFCFSRLKRPELNFQRSPVCEHNHLPVPHCPVCPSGRPLENTRNRRVVFSCLLSLGEEHFRFNT